MCLDGTLPLKAPEKPLATGTTGRRLALANWLTDPRHPLTARVMVNRVWMLHFGRGPVGSPGDFGRLGERATHPELLDWLASEFVAQGWCVKKLHRLILTSTAYRQSSARDATEAFRKPPAPVPPKAGAKAPEPPAPEARALAAFCQALLSSNRFLYVE